MNLLSVTEIVSSLQGEGKHTGYPCTFIRFHGCNLRCRWCDAPHAVTKRKRKKMSIDTVCTHAYRMGNNYVCITGGEPLLQDDCLPLVYELQTRGYKVSIETNGSIEIDAHYPRSYHFTMDIKCPSSGMTNHNCYENLEELLAQDEVKFVIQDIEDYCFAKEVLEEYNVIASIIFSPMFDKQGNSNACDLAQWILEDKIYNARLGVQIHKLVGFY
jgi:7-carboxy-7-deazaguanine synthase